MIYLLALLFCCGNTIVAYGVFTEALHICQAAKVSGVLAMARIFTFLSLLVAVKCLPQHFSASHLEHWAYIGAAVVVIGSALTSKISSQGLFLAAQLIKVAHTHTIEIDLNNIDITFPSILKR